METFSTKQLINTIELTPETRGRIFNMVQGSNAVQLKDYVGREIKIKNVVMHQLNEMDDEGNPKILVCIEDEEGVVYQTLSPTVADSLHMMNTYYRLGEEIVNVRVASGRSKAGREFLQLDIV